MSMFIYFVYYAKNTQNNNLINDVNEIPVASVTHDKIIEKEISECRNVIKTELIAALEIKKEQMQETANNIYPKIHKLHISEMQKETLVQSIGNGLDVDHYRAETSWHKNIHYSTLTPVRGKPDSLKGMVRQQFIVALNTRNYTEISNMLFKKVIGNKSTYGGKSVLSAVISDNPAISISDIKNLTKSGAQPNLYDVKTAISSGLSTAAVEFLIKTGSFELTESWYEDKVNYNILTYAAWLGKFEHAYFLYTNFGINLSVQHDYTLIDVMETPEAGQATYAEALIDAFIKAGLVPYKNSSIKKLSLWLDAARIRQLTGNINRMPSSHLRLDDINDKSLTAEKREKLEQLIAVHNTLSHDVSLITRQLKNCFESDAVGAKLASDSAVKTSQQPQDSFGKDYGKFVAQQYSQQFLSAQSLLQSRKYDEALSSIDSIVNTSGETAIYDLYLNSLISSKADKRHLQNVIQRGGKFSAESIFIMIYSDNSEAIDLYTDFYPNINIKSPDGQTPLEFAISIGSSSIIVEKLRKFNE